MENIKHKEELRERTIASRFQPQFGSHGSVSRQHALAQCNIRFARNDLKYIIDMCSIDMVLTVRFHKSRFAWFPRLGFTSHGSHCSHGSVSRVTVRMVLTARFHEPRFAWFSRLGFTSHGSHVVDVRYMFDRCSIYVREKVR